VFKRVIATEYQSTKNRSEHKIMILDPTQNRVKKSWKTPHRLIAHVDFFQN